MKVVRKKKYIYVAADSGKILVMGEDKFFTAYLPLTTDIGAINEIDYIPEPDPEDEGDGIEE